MSNLSVAWMGVVPNRIRAPLPNVVVVCGLRARMMYSTFSNASSKANCGCGAMLGREESLSLEVVEESGVCFGPPDFKEAAAEDDFPEGKARELVAARKALALGARGSGLRSHVCPASAPWRPPCTPPRPPPAASSRGHGCLCSCLRRRAPPPPRQNQIKSNVLTRAWDMAVGCPQQTAKLVRTPRTTNTRIQIYL